MTRSMVPGRDRLGRGLLAAFALSGAAALIYEVAWTRSLSLVVGSTTYAVSTMLATFMGGLAIGAFVGGRIADRTKNLVAAFAFCELGIGVTGIVSVPLIYALPGAYLAIYRLFHEQPTLFFALQILLCALVMLVPTILMGATFPIVSRAVARRMEALGRDVGAAYGVNTIGAVVGSLVAGFLLVPWLGLRGTALVAGLVNLLVGGALLLASGSRRRSATVAVGLLFLGAAALNLRSEGRFGLVNYYSAHRLLDGVPYAELVAENDRELRTLVDQSYAEGHLRAYRTRNDHLLLQLGGKIEGTGARDVTNTLLLAYLPAASRADPRRALVIGLGAGVTLEAMKEAVPEVDVVEIHPGVVDVVRRFGPPDVLDGVRLFNEDARTLLMRSEERWDVISSEPSYPTESVVSHLFTREYYELAASRLEPGGVFAQWLPYHLLTNDDVAMMLRTFGAVFPEAYLWKIPEGLDLILVGSRQPFERDAAAIRGEVARLNAGRWPLGYVLSRTPEQIRTELVSTSGPLHTDDRPLLEFRAARNLLAGDLAALEAEQGAAVVR